MKNAAAGRRCLKDEPQGAVGADAVIFQQGFLAAGSLGLVRASLGWEGGGVGGGVWEAPWVSHASEAQQRMPGSDERHDTLRVVPMAWQTR